MKLSIVIPCYNEAKTIRQIVERVRTAAVPGVDKEIIVVGAGSASVPPGNAALHSLIAG